MNKKHPHNRAERLRLKELKDRKRSEVISTLKKDKANELREEGIDAKD